MHRYLVFVLVLAGSPAGARGESTPVATVTFAEALGAVGELPELMGARAQASAVARTSVPRAWPALALTLTPTARLAPDGQRGFEGGVAAQQAIPLADVVGARRAATDALGRQRQGEAVALALDARLQIAAAWIDAWEAMARREAADRDRALAQSIVDVTARGVTAGAFTGPELADARAFAAEASARAIDAEGAVADAGFTLAAATGRPSQLLAAGALPAPEVPAPTAWPALVARARELPAVAARRLAARTARLRAVEEQRARGAHLVLGGELLRDAPGALAAVATIGIALPHDRGEREAGLALAEALAVDGHAEALAARAAVDLARALHDVEHTGALLAQLEGELIPAVDDAAARRRRAYELGETTIVELIAAQRTAVTAHARVASAKARHAWARVRAWLLLQTAEVVS